MNNTQPQVQVQPQMVQAQPQVGLKAFNALITNSRTQDYLFQVLGDKKEAFVNNITALVANNQLLQNCDPKSIMYAGIKATALDLPFDSNLGFAYVIPYSGVAQFQLGWRGFVQLALRSGQVTAINVRDVKAGEIVGEDFVSGELQFKSLPQEYREQAPTIGYVAFFRLANGFQKMLYMSVAELRIHGQKYSKTFNNKNGRWAIDFDAMAKKTVIKLLLNRWAPLSVQMQQAVLADQAVIGENGSLTYVDNDPDVQVVPTDEETQAKTDEIADAIIAQTETTNN